MHLSISSSTSDSIFELPADVQLEYLAEGGANVVYRILLPSQSQDGGDDKVLHPPAISYDGTSTPSSTETEEDLTITVDIDTDVNIAGDKLLRLRKNVPFGLPYSETANDFHTRVRPLFAPEELVDQFLVRIPPAVIQRCNANLLASERIGKRPAIRHGVYLAENEPLGMLITDMTNPNPSSSSSSMTLATTTIAIVELKPKWLIQSPSAPANARRCRTCALRDMKNADNKKTKGIGVGGVGVVTPPRKTGFCPLDLISDKEEDMQRAIQRTFPAYASSNLIRVISKALYQHSTLMKLLSLQRLHNQVGLQGPPCNSNGTSLSMTLRDCSVFLKIPSSASKDANIDIDIDIRLGDLDLKSAANGKAEYWLNIENRLIQEGWYMGQQPDQSSTDGECVLSR